MKIERLTNQKRAILDYLKNTSSHPDAYEIFAVVKKKLPQISLATVYRNLDSMTKKGLIRAIRIKDDRFNYDGHPENRNHFHCSDCGRLYNISDDILLNFEKLSEEDFVGVVTEYEIMLKGTCLNCQRKEKIKNLK